MLAGAHEREAPPDADALRWGPSVILRPDSDALSQIQRWTEVAIELAGPSHWSTGSESAAHITVRTLGPRRSGEPDAHLVGRWAGAVNRAVGGRQLSFLADRMLITPISVMLGLQPTDDAPNCLVRSLASALGVDGWFEQDRVRDIWYVNLVHFTGPVAYPAALARWVARFPVDPSFCVRGRSLDIVRWQFDGARMQPQLLARAPLPA